MKRNLLLSSLFTTALFTSVFSQESVNIQAYSELINLADYESSLPEIVLPAMNLDEVRAEDELRTKQGEFERIGITRSVDLNLNNSGVWSQLPNGDRIWRLKVTSVDATATAFFFNDFFMPSGGRVHIYNPDKSNIIGAFTSYNNHESGVFATDNIIGETAILEYYEPASQAGRGRISINEFGHIYRHAHPELITENQWRIDESDACEVDVACSPENIGWTDQIKSVVRIRVKVGSSFGYCTGSVVNNTALDCTPYVLTAWHCGEGASTADFNSWVIYFNFQKTGCGTGSASTSNSMTGSTMRANSNDGGGSTGSDFLLIEMNNIIPVGYNPYFSGWDRTSYTSPNSENGVGIHHPAGDCKKISRYTNNVTSTSYGGSTANTHWRFSWSATTNGHGVTEGGSSGSGIFRDDNKLLWGTLTGGASFCTQTNGQDYYGKMSFHWTSNGSAANRQLKPWLDPTNSNVNTLTGTYYPCVNSVNEFELGTIISLYPNPSTGMIHLSIAEENVDALTVTVYNMLGEEVYTGKISSGATSFSIDLSNEAEGVYLVTVNSPVSSVSKKVILSK